MTTMKLGLKRTKNIVGQGENGCYQHFLHFSQCFQNVSFTGSLKVWIELTDYEIINPFLAHLSTTCSRGAFRVVICPSCIVFKHLLLPNRWASLDQTWQECFLGGPLQKLFTEFDSIKNSGCHGNEIEFF